MEFIKSRAIQMEVGTYSNYNIPCNLLVQISWVGFYNYIVSTKFED